MLSLREINQIVVESRKGAKSDMAHALAASAMALAREAEKAGLPKKAATNLSTAWVRERIFVRTLPAAQSQEDLERVAREARWYVSWIKDISRKGPAKVRSQVVEMWPAVSGIRNFIRKVEGREKLEPQERSRFLAMAELIAKFPVDSHLIGHLGNEKADKFLTAFHNELYPRIVRMVDVKWRTERN